MLFLRLAPLSTIQVNKSYNKEVLLWLRRVQKAKVVKAVAGSKQSYTSTLSLQLNIESAVLTRFSVSIEEAATAGKF